MDVEKELTYSKEFPLIITKLRKRGYSLTFTKTDLCTVVSDWISREYITCEFLDTGEKIKKAKLHFTQRKLKDEEIGQDSRPYLKYKGKGGKTKKRDFPIGQTFRIYP